MCVCVYVRVWSRVVNQLYKNQLNVVTKIILKQILERKFSNEKYMTYNELSGKRE